MEISEITLICLAVIILFKIIEKTYKYYLWLQKLCEIPGPRISTSWELTKVKQEDRLKWVHKIASRYNGLFKMWVGIDPLILTDAPEYAEVVLRSTQHIEKSMIYEYIEPWLGKGLLTSTGEKWFHDRKLITPAFHFGILEDFAEVMVEKASIFNQRLREQVELHGNKPFDIFNMTGKCALDIICETAMGVNVDAQSAVENEYSQAVECIAIQAVHRVMRPWLKSNWIYYRTENGKRFKAAIETTHRRSTRVIEQKKIERQQRTKLDNATAKADDGIEKKTRRAFLDSLLEASENTVKPMTIEEIREQVNTFMFAGHDTTGALMSWTLFCIGNDEKVQNSIHQELDEVLGDSSEPVTTKQVHQLKYLDRVIKEVLRMYPSATTIGRQISEDLQMGPYTLPAACVLSLQIYLLHRNPKHWPNPTHFDPDRFLPENCRDRHPYSYIPFSGGLRNCIGQKFALLEAKIVLTEVLRKWRVQSRDNHDNIQVYNALILRPHEGVFMNFYPRS